MLLSVHVTRVLFICSTGEKFCPDYGLLLELHALTLVARSYALSVQVTIHTCILILFPYLVAWYPLPDVLVTSHPSRPIGILANPLGHVWFLPHPRLWLEVRVEWRGWSRGCSLWVVLAWGWNLWGILQWQIFNIPPMYVVSIAT